MSREQSNVRETQSFTPIGDLEGRSAGGATSVAGGRFGMAGMAFAELIGDSRGVSREGSELAR